LNLKIIFGYILICLIWGSTWYAIKLGLAEFPPMYAAGLRFSLAAIFIYIFMLIRGLKIQKDKLSLRLYWIMGIFSFVIPFSLVYWAEQYIPTGLASVLFATFPFFVTIFSKFFLPGESVDFHKVIGVILGFTGIVVIFSDDISLDFKISIIGMIAVIVSAAMQGGIAVMVKKYGKHLNPLSMNFIPLLTGGVVLLIASFFLENLTAIKYSPVAVGSVVYLAFFGTLVTFTIYYWLMQRINVVVLSLSAFITPIIAVLIGWLFAAEVFTVWDIAGSSLVLIGILFANFKGLKIFFKSNKEMTV